MCDARTPRDLVAGRSGIGDWTTGELQLEVISG
jgi:hypothetical protein